MRISEILAQATKKLRDNNKEERAGFELLRDLLNLESYEMYNQINEEVTDDIKEQFEKKLALYINNVPLQHILGYETFLGRNFRVSQDVLIPRYETEELVANILYRIDQLFENYDNIEVADVGTGSGAIAVSLDLEEPKTKVYATDISSKALRVAKSNNDEYCADVTFYKGDLLEPLIKESIKVDLLISNPPYLKDSEILESSVIDHEPQVALFGGSDGLDFYRRLFSKAQQVIKDQALLAFEIGYDQKETLSKEVQKYFAGDEFEIIKDINGKDRMLFIYHNIAKY